MNKKERVDRKQVGVVGWVTEIAKGLLESERSANDSWRLPPCSSRITGCVGARVRVPRPTLS